MTQITDATEPPPAPPRRFGPAGREFSAFVEYFALSGIAVAQPLLEALRIRASDAVLPLRPSSGEILLLTAAILLAVPVGLWVVEAVVGLIAPTARERFHRIALAGLVGIITFIVVGDQWSLSFGATAVIACIVALVAGRVLRRFEAARLFVRFLAFAPVVFAVVFLTGPAIAPLVRGSDRVAAADVEVGDPKRVLEIVADEFPITSLMDGSGHIDRALFPNIARLADDATWYRNTTSVAPYTQAAVPAIATGRYPEHPNDMTTAQNFPNTVFSLLGGTYDIHAREIASESLCSVASCAAANSNPTKALAENARDLWWEFASPGGADMPKCLCDANTLDDGLPSAKGFLRKMRPAAGPIFDYLHVLLPHAPWHLQPNGQSYDKEFRVPRGLSLETLRWTSQRAADSQRQRHLLQLQAFDTYLGHVMDKLDRWGEYDDTLIVLTADHGVSFTGETHYRLPTRRNFHEIMWVPLLVKQPGNAGGGTVDDRPARTIDVMPTIADALNVRIPWRIDGRSLLKAPTDDVDRRFLEWPSGFSFLAPKDAQFKQYDTTVGFQRVLATPAVNPTLPTPARIYGYGAAVEYSALIGRATTPLVDATAPGRFVIITNARDYTAVNTRAPYAPWTNVEGGLNGKEQVPIAVSVNGVIAGIARTTPSALGTPAFTAILDPKYFVDGLNDVQVYVIEGPPDAPRLVLAKRV